jgi:hypothetical protein
VCTLLDSFAWAHIRKNKPSMVNTGYFFCHQSTLYIHVAWARLFHVTVSEAGQ